MKAVKLKIYQNMVNYRKEMNFKYVQTYPLPTFSMIKGMLHYILKLREFKKLKISVQGNYENVATNMQKIIKFDSIRDDVKKNYVDPRQRINVRSKNPNTTINTGLMFVDSIIDMNLIIHFWFDDEELNYNFVKDVYKNIITLGRNEDIARIDECKIVEIYKEDNGKVLTHNIYLSKDICIENKMKGTHFRIPFYYETVKSFEDKRIFKFSDVVYIAKDTKIKEDITVSVDEDNDIVSFFGV